MRGDGGQTRQRGGISALGRSDLGFREESVPEVVRREVRVGGGEDRNEAVFACPYCPLCRVRSVSLWGHKHHRQPLRE
jgi:hypothetical protein